MGVETQDQTYLIYDLFKHEKWAEVFIIPGYVYDFYLETMYDCQLEEFIYDMFFYCDK